MTSYQHLNDFIQFLTTEKRYSSHTIRSYKDDIIQFSDFLNTTYSINNFIDVKGTFVRTWLSQLRDEGITPKTINRKISSLKTLYKFLLIQGQITVSPMLHITSPKVSKRLPQYVEEDAVKALLTNIDFGDDYDSVLHKTIVSLFYYTGMRLSELQQLKVSDISMSNHTIKVLGKGNKERILPMVAALEEQLMLYMNLRASIQVNEPTQLLLIRKNGVVPYTKYIYNVVRQYLGTVTTINKKSPHILRHSFATHLTNNGAELNAVKELLGHASLAATQIYTHNSIDKLKNAHKKAHPKG